MGYCGCEMFGMCDIRDAVCLRCGMLGEVRYWGCGMFGMWDVQDLGYSRCGMWDMGCLLKCGMLIYKMPSNDSFKHCYVFNQSNYYSINKNIFELKYIWRKIYLNCSLGRNVLKHLF